jgi:hypothetical protein
MEHISRRQLLRVGVGAGGATSAGGANATDRRTLDRTIRSSSVPPVVVSLPADWTAHEQLLANLVRPRQLLAVSNVALQPTRNHEHFLPDVAGLGDAGVLLMVYGDERASRETDAPLLPAAPIRLERFEKHHGEVPGFRRWVQWFESERYTYTVSLWVGRRGDAATAKAVTESLELV